MAVGNGQDPKASQRRQQPEECSYLRRVDQRETSGQPGTERELGWDGLVNGRHLGGLTATDGARLDPRALARSAVPHTLTALGWHQLVEHGITSIIDLRHDWEIERQPLPDHADHSDVTHRAIPLEPASYIETRSHRDDAWKLNTPPYYDEFLTEHGSRIVTVLTAIADAPPGGVLIHCVSGRDRAGLAVAMVLDLLGVEHDAIVADHWLSFERPHPVQVNTGTATDAAAPKLTRDQHREVMHRLLLERPATSCFTNTRQAEQLRRRLARRLCPSTRA